MKPKTRPGVFVSFKGRELNDVFDAIKSIDGISLGVGYKDQETTDIAKVNNFGNEDIPARDYLTRAAINILSLSDKASKSFSRLAGARALKRRPTEAFLALVGNQIIAAVHHQLDTTRDWAEPNKPSTLRKKQGDKPLVDEEDRLREELAIVIIDNGQ